MNETATKIGRMGLLATVFTTGAAVMVIELLGTRMIAPFYGASLYVWSSLISVTMIALAVGYFIGGRLADNSERIGLSVIIALAGVFTLIIPWLTRPVLLATDPLGLRMGAFTSALVLFFPALTLLGMVGPFAIKRITDKLDGVGNSAGTIYAVSTIGSVIGTLTLGFFLFPAVGSRQILVDTGLILLAWAILVGIYEQKVVKRSLALAPSLVLALIGLLITPKIISAGHAYGHNDKFRIQSEQESLYGWVRVIDEPGRDLRMLTSDASMIGAAGINDGMTRMSYQDIVSLMPALAEKKMTKALVIGLGAGHMAKVLRNRYGIETDTLEIDPAVADAASRYFGFYPTGRAIVGDARYEIRHLTGPYDLIIHDCFTGGSEPSHLLTVETLTQLRGLMSEQGMLALNFVGFAHGEPSKALAAVAKTVHQVFPELTVFISEPDKDFNDFIFLAGHKSVNLTAATLLPGQTDWLKQRVFNVDDTNGIIFTDNLNPLEHLQTAKAEHYRHMIVEWFGPELLVR
ncbi:fused MFS/spermidine synthase [Methylocucumis oryzae]|uniref:SAM-dependent methlyltransferase n=1 Tax=Methylocucumis oryzae TaxID=1632867 RepID=A0A0F3IPK8_9GAMM|nr:fused MFS/spermidine synthase [Methylocucumis oryzae]KJV07539.1 SAM-dependent methlyltransferase [Methylocucumis oryzae]